jgi:ribosomal protein L4
MELKIVSLDGKAAGSVELPDAIFGPEPSDILHRWCAGSSPNASAARMTSKPQQDQPHL